MTQVTKAIIPVAGWGTRRLPITKAIEKCMLPVGNRPIVDYVVRDCIKAGITDIYFVVNRGSRQIFDYYSENERLNQFLEYNGKQDLMELAHVPQGINFHYLEQDSNAKYGTAVPVALVFPQIKKDESVLFIQGDAFTYNVDGSSEAAKLMAATPAGGASVMSSEVPIEEVGRYGVIDFNDETGAFERIVEKPSPDQAPSNQINLGNYILNYDLASRIANYCQIEISGEYFITEPISQYVLDKGVVNVY
ncbi:hypothetical protein KDA23_07730, partial [Candidatus Saccharibacteria bacterium]|nr:hypothetical protein [Candidatus Saccharibacteria bacterium]